jgi:hypothetical protein
MQIRFYHIWVYKLFFLVWSPILKSRPDVVSAFRDNIDQWNKHEINRKRNSFRIVDK